MTEPPRTAGVITIDGKQIGPGHACFIIAEVGVNHNGDPEIARQMIDAAAEAGVDCVKFQTFSAEEFCNSAEDIYEYVSQGEVVRESMLEMFRRLELRRDEFARLFDYARKRGLVPLSTPADCPAVDLLEGIGAGAFKVGSDDLVHTPFLRYVAGKGKPIIISTGMADAADIDRAVAAVTSTGNRQLAILHCVSLYPTPPEQVNLRRMTALEQRYPFPVGFSDHSFGITAAVGAVSLGARIVEKHFTLDRDMPGPDHRFSADPVELQALVRTIRDVEQSLGDGSLALSPDERRMAELCHRSIIAARDIAAGETLSDADVGFKRPGAGLMPYQIDLVLGRRARRAIPAGSVIVPDMLGDAS
jgi:N,N'-diacetyllegionaminate synthase